MELVQPVCIQINLPEQLPLATLERMAQALAPHELRLVGGVVRDWIHHTQVSTDIDLATTATPDDMLKQLTDAGFKVIPTGLDHGTVTVVADGYTFEITTLREDVHTDGRHATVSFVDDWYTDSCRRDFTMNALYCTLGGDVYDYHDGLSDLEEGRVRFIGDAATRLEEDWLRLLRYFRFRARLSDASAIEPELKDVLAQAVPQLGVLSVERIGVEWRKLLSYDAPQQSLQDMQNLDVFKQLELPQPNIEALNTKTNDHLTREVMLFGLADTAWFKAKPLQHTKAEQQALGQLAKAVAEQTYTALWQLVYVYRRETVERLLCLRGNQQQLRQLADVQEKEFPLSGADVMAVGMDAGPRVGEVLKKLEHEWLQQNAPDRDVMLKRLTNLVAAS